MTVKKLMKELAEVEELAEVDDSTKVLILNGATGDMHEVNYVMWPREEGGPVRIGMDGHVAQKPAK